MLDPFGQEADSLVKICDPRGQGLQRKETEDWLPRNRHLVIEEGVSCGIKLFRHNHLTN